jgi:hypothetical protein
LIEYFKTKEDNKMECLEITNKEIEKLVKSDGQLCKKCGAQMFFVTTTLGKRAQMEKDSVKKYVLLSTGEFKPIFVCVNHLENCKLENK